mmetsp:Transcript_26229/g.61993  ORF Transcript_26229/g.61993 Transcript_26229/m.61993 type:complete len:252 (-) Transcript_26229:1448-2203(-)
MRCGGVAMTVVWPRSSLISTAWAGSAIASSRAKKRRSNIGILHRPGPGLARDHQRQPAAQPGHILVEPAEFIDKVAHLAAQRRHAPADLVGHEDDRRGQAGQQRQQRAAFALPAGMVWRGLHRHQPVGEPQRQAVDHDQPTGCVGRAEGIAKRQRRLDGVEAGRPVGAVVLNARLHLRVGSQRRGDDGHLAAPGLPAQGQAFGLARLAAALAADDEFVRAHRQVRAWGSSAASPARCAVPTHSRRRSSNRG